MSAKFKFGDRVRVNGNHYLLSARGHIGTIVRTNADFKVVVAIDDFDEGWADGGLLLNRWGFDRPDSQLELSGSESA